MSDRIEHTTEIAHTGTSTDPAVPCPSCLARRDRKGWPKDWQGRMRDGWHDLMRPGDDCGGAPDWCLAPNGVECAQHDENGDRRG